MEQRICIICRLPKSDFNEEHVIPESLGGFYVIKSVCTECNSMLGQKVDSTIIEQTFMVFNRQRLKIKGKKGSIPNPFKGDHTFANSTEHKVRLDYIEGQGFIPYTLPLIKKISSEGEPLLFSVTLDEQDATRIDTIIEKIAKRNKAEIDPTKRQVTIETIEDNRINMKLKIDIKKYKMGLLKIAYEFIIENIPAYVNDPQSKIISSILHRCDFENLEKIAWFGSIASKKTFEPFAKIINVNEDSHYLILHGTNKGGTMCTINLFNTIIHTFKLSNKNLIKDKFLILENDILNKTYSIMSLHELMDKVFKPWEVIFRYAFNSPFEAKMFQALQTQPNFLRYQANKSISLFDRSNKIKYENFEIKIRNMIESNQDIDDGTQSVINYYEMDEELYVKILPWNLFVRVAAIIMQRDRR